MRSVGLGANPNEVWVDGGAGRTPSRAMPWRAILPAAVGTAVACLVGVAAGAGAAGWGTEPMKVSTTGPSNLLPSYFFMAGAEEGGAYQKTGVQG